MDTNPERRLSDKLLRRGPCDILIELLSEKAYYITSLVEKCGMTYSHTFRILETYEKANLIRTEKMGRERKIDLTSYGKKVATYLK